MATHTDPVCGMKVDDQKAAARSTHEGKTYYFCSQSCKSKFEQDPKKSQVNSLQAESELP